MTSTATPTPASRILPPGLDEKQFTEAIVRFREVVGEEHVISEPSGLAAFHDPYPVGAEPAGGASAVVCPADTAQVQAVVRIANEYGSPRSPPARTTVTAAPPPA